MAESLAGLCGSRNKLAIPEGNVLSKKMFMHAKGTHSGVSGTVMFQSYKEEERMKLFKLCLVMVAVVALAGTAMAGTLEDVRAKGYIQAGVNGDLFGFGKPDAKGVWKGLDVDTARAIAVAVFGDADKVKFTPLTAKTR
ncbi:MAG: hypothetical protein JRI93_04510, partial [Deltaproteobacteria bacterium]|nr:hypothetical protein [Deltaproteobacteria bacterium]